MQVKDYNGSSTCEITLVNAANGQVIDFKTATPGKNNNTVGFDAVGYPTAYLTGITCAVRVSAP